MQRIIIAVIFFIVASSFANAQNTPLDTGKIEIIQDPQIAELLNKQIEINSKAPIQGYRIKIHFGADKNKANEIRGKFISLFPNVPAYSKYDQPNFNIRVGDFRTKLEAFKFLKEAQVEFPAAFVVRDEIELPKLDIPEQK